MLLSKTEQEKETQIISAVKKISTHLKTLKIKQNDINFMLIKLTI